MMQEQKRQQAISRYNLSGSDIEPVFDRVSRLAATMFDTPIALVTVLALEWQLFRGSCGLSMHGTRREIAFCEHAVRSSDVMVVVDAHVDPRFASNPLVTGEPFIRFYAGAPIRVADGVAVGTLCLIDHNAREFGREDRVRLQMLADTVSDIIELRAGSLVAQERQIALERQAQLLKGTVDNIEQGIAVFSDELRLILWNNQFFDLFDFPRDLAVLGVEAEKLLRIAASRGELGPGDPNTIVRNFVLSTRTTSSRRLEIARVSGQRLEVWRSTMSDGNFILAASDVTASRELARTKDEFLSTVNHELRTPLTSILGSLSLLDAGHVGRLPPRAEKLVSVARQNGERLNALINDLLDIEKLATSGLVVQPVPLELSLLLQKAVEQNKPYAESFNVRLKLLLIVHEPIWVMGDESRMLQALANLISNGVKFSAHGGSVQLTLFRDKNWARIAVVDQGSGIPSAFREHLFKRFAQASPSDAKTKGTGLGLAITKAIVEQHKGRISYETSAAGTSFFIDLPVADQLQEANP